MRALDPEVVDAVWDQLKDLLPEPVDEHPLACHRHRVDNRVCFRGILIRLSTGCSWEDAERLIDHAASDTTLRSRRSEWLNAGVFDSLFLNALAEYDRVIRLDLAHAAIDGSQHKAPCGGPGTGRNPTDRGKIGRKRSILCDFTGIPLGWVTEGANRHDTILLAPTIAAVPAELLARIGTLHLDRGYDNSNVRIACGQAGLDSVNIALKRQRRPGPDRPRVNIAPTHGCRTTANSAATPTETPNTDQHRSPSPSPSSSPRSSSTTDETHLSAEPLNAVGL